MKAEINYYLKTGGIVSVKRYNITPKEISDILDEFELTKAAIKLQTEGKYTVIPHENVDFLEIESY